MFGERMNAESVGVQQAHLLCIWLLSTVLEYGS
jgi:hypothetical protein